MTFYKTLKSAINSLADKGFIFSNESQFQFNLAWELQNQGYEILFEVLASPVDNFNVFSYDKPKKSYIDLIVKNDNNEYYAIELKYKVPQKNIQYRTKLGNSYTFSQGAPDLGAFLFWKDVERLEMLGTQSLTLNFDKNIKIIKKYAILLTNDNMYWEGNEKSLCKEFFPKDKKEVKDRLCWHILLDKQTQKRISGKSKRDGEYVTEHIVSSFDDAKKYCQLNDKKKPVDPILIKNTYKCEWNKYPCNVGEKPEFKYLILEIP